MTKGTIYDVNNYRIGDYIYLDNPETDQAFLDQMCDWFIQAYEKDNRFFISYDLETQGLIPRNKKILLHSICWKKDQAILVRDRGFNFDRLKEALSKVPIVGQNIKFDAKFVKHHYDMDLNIMLDTMVAAMMGYTDTFPGKRFSLDNIVAAHFPFIKMNKQIRNSFIDRDYEDDFEIEEIEYAVGDSILTYWLVEPLIKRLILTEQWEMFKNIEMPVLTEFVASELHGIPVNYEGLGLYYEELGETLTVMLQDLQDLINKDHPGLLASNKKFTKGIFNPKSSQQVPELLSKYKIFVPSSSKDVMKVLGETNSSDIVTKINEYRKTSDQRSKLVKGWYETQTDTETFRSYPTFFTYGAATGRFSVKEPPMQTVTGPLRGYVVAEPGYSIVQFDYSSFEFRALAAVTGQEQLLTAFNEQERLTPKMMEIGHRLGIDDPDALVKAYSGGHLKNLGIGDVPIITAYGNNDIHRMNASLMLGQPIESIKSVERTIAKCVQLDTLITTNKGLITLRSLLPKKPVADTYYPVKGLKVLCDTGWKDSPEIYYNGKQEGYRITTQSGRRITCTKVHKFRTLDVGGLYSWKVADDLVVGNSLILNFNKGSLTTLSEEKQRDAILILLSLLEAKGTIKGSLVYEYLLANYVGEVKALKDGLTIKSESLKELLNYTVIPNWVLDCDFNQLLDNKLSKYLFRNLGNLNIYGDDNLLRTIQICLQNSGILSSLVTEPTHSSLGIPFISISRIDKDKVGYLSYSKDQIKGKTFYELKKESLSKSAQKDHDFLVENNLYCDPIVSIKAVKEIECGDLSVPDGNTLTYNGIVAHNTFGYATLYGSGAPTIREGLAKDGIFYTEKEVRALIDQFYVALDKVKLWFNDTHEFVYKNGYTKTPLGRRRYFDIPPKWKTNLYEKSLADARRAGVNHILQGCNADAIKIAMVEMMNEFRLSLPADEVPVIILQVHDELVLYCKTEIAPFVADTCKKWMVYGGRKATLDKVAISCSGGIFERWSK